MDTKNYMDGSEFDSASGSDDIYFAAKNATDTAGIVLNKGASFFNMLTANAYLEKLSMMWKAYHGIYNSDLGFGHQINFTGEQGELVSLPVNHFRNLAQHIYVMITANRPVMDCRAINTDYKSLAQTYLANGILDYYMREKHLEDAIKKATELSVVLGSGFVKLAWNATAGEAYDIDPETGEFNFEGELEFTTLSQFDVVVDGTKENWDNDWIMCRSFKNRYDLMAKYPEYAEKIKGMSPKNQSAVYRLAVFSNDDTDDIPIYEFYHRKTESMPEGRYMLFVDSEVVLLDTKMPYRVIPVFRIVPGEILGTPYGYTPMFDIFPIQESINALYSTIMTNQNAFGVQNVFIPRGADIAVSYIEGGLNIIEANAKPEALNLTQTPAEVFKFLETMVQAAETISGVNSVTRGNPEASLKSGTALALVQSMSLQFISGLQQSYVKLIEDVGTSVIQILKDFAMTPKTIALVGKNNRALLKEFTGDQISSINRVIVDVGNPLSKTIAGRVQMAEQMMQMNVIKTPQQYFQVMNTGRLDSMYEGEMSQLLCVKSENEDLMDGKTDVHALVTDIHKLHIEEHRAVLDNPDLRRDPILTKNVLDHIQEHIDLLRNTDPALLTLLGQEPLQPAAPNTPPIDNTPSSITLTVAPGPTAPGPTSPDGPPAASANGSPNSEIMSPSTGQPQPANQQQISGPGVQNQRLPNLPKVPASLLSNPALQEASLNNVNIKR